MTVRRHADQKFEATPQSVAAAIRKVLARRPPYIDFQKEGDLAFRTNVRPSRWLLGTEMTVRMEPSSNETNVIAETKSQWFILGDVFNYYDRFIRDFFGDLRRELQNKEPNKPGEGTA